MQWVLYDCSIRVTVALGVSSNSRLHAARVGTSPKGAWQTFSSMFNLLKWSWRCKDKMIETRLWHLDTLLKGSVLIGKISTSIWFCCMKKRLMEDKSNNKAQRSHTRRNPKRHILLVSLLLCCKITAVWCFIWYLGLRMWAGSEAVRRNFKYLRFF